MRALNVRRVLGSRVFGGNSGRAFSDRIFVAAFSLMGASVFSLLAFDRKRIQSQLAICYQPEITWDCFTSLWGKVY